MNGDMFAPLGLTLGGGTNAPLGASGDKTRARDLKAQQKSLMTQEVDFKKLLEESQRMS